MSETKPETPRDNNDVKKRAFIYLSDLCAKNDLEISFVEGFPPCNERSKYGREVFILATDIEKIIELETQQLQQRVDLLEIANRNANALIESGVNEAQEINEKLQQRVRELEECWLPCDQTIQCAHCGYIPGYTEGMHSNDCPIGYLCNQRDALDSRIRELEAERDCLQHTKGEFQKALTAYEEQVQKLEAEVETLKTAKDHNWNEVLDWERWGKEVTEDFKLPCDQHKVSWRVAITEHMVNLKAEVERLKKDETFYKNTLASIAEAIGYTSPIIIIAVAEKGETAGDVLIRGIKALQSSHTTLRNAAEEFELFATHLPSCEPLHSSRPCSCGFALALTNLRNASKV